jgi:hypothetical protein
LVEAHRAGELPPGSIFTSLDAASGFFRCAPAGYAATTAQGVVDGVELETAGWTLEPLRLDRVTSSFFDDRRFPIAYHHARPALISSQRFGGEQTGWTSACFCWNVGRNR